MKIGTLRDIADLSDEDFALVLQALPAIRKEIRAFTEKMTPAVGKNDCDFLTYDFQPNGEKEAEKEFSRWIMRVIEKTSDVPTVNEARLKRLQEENKKLHAKKLELELECGRLRNELESKQRKSAVFPPPFTHPIPPDNYWMGKEKDDFYSEPTPFERAFWKVDYDPYKTIEKLKNLSKQ